MRNSAIAVLATWTALYLLWAFVEWNLNAGDWSSSTRYFLAWVALFFGALAGALTYSTGEE